MWIRPKGIQIEHITVRLSFYTVCVMFRLPKITVRRWDLKFSVSGATASDVASQPLGARLYP